jgi:uncharacterized protein YihD (DUF1040 family)
MRNPKRIDKIIELIKDEWEKSPDLRFCQLVNNIIYPLTDSGRDIFYIEDDEFEYLINEYKM